jgi:arrestin-related trafficking adapter 3/6
MSVPSELNLAQARLYPTTPNNSAPSLLLTSPLSSRRNSFDVPSHSSLQFPVTGAIKTLCNRGAAIISVHLAEPVLYLTGFEASEYTDRSPAMLRGSLILKLLKPSKIKAITLSFKGRARTEWPEGIPPRKVEFFEEKELMTHTWPFFNAQFSSSELSHGADAARFLDSQRLSVDLSRSSMDSVSSLALSDAPSSRSVTPVGSPNLLAVSGGNSHFGIPFGQSRSFSKEDKTVTQSRGYRMFAAGEYIYNFELPLDSVLPESVECDMGSVRYELEATVERYGAFKSNLSGKTEVLLVRNPGEQNTELNEPISISRTWFIYIVIPLTT